MTDSTALDRRYRRLLALYPKAFRRDREREILSVLMDRAAPRQQWPRPAEAVDLFRHAMWMRLKQVGRSRSERAHPVPWVVVRVLIGLWLVILTAICCEYHRWWGLALVAPASLHFSIAYRIASYAEHERDATG